MDASTIASIISAAAAVITLGTVFVKLGAVLQNQKQINKTVDKLLEDFEVMSKANDATHHLLDKRLALVEQSLGAPPAAS